MSYTSKFTGSQIDELLDASSAMRTSKEDTSNKVANFDNPNDSTFPTTKAVKDYVNAELAAKEDTANKVTTIGADATDEQYPSAKAVKDKIDELGRELNGFEESYVLEANYYALNLNSPYKEGTIITDFEGEAFYFYDEQGGIFPTGLLTKDKLPYRLEKDAFKISNLRGGELTIISKGKLNTIVENETSPILEDLSEIQDKITSYFGTKLYIQVEEGWKRIPLDNILKAGTIIGNFQGKAFYFYSTNGVNDIFPTGTLTKDKLPYRLEKDAAGVTSNTSEELVLKINGSINGLRKLVNIYISDSQSEIFEKLLEAYNSGDCDLYWETGTYVFDSVYLYMLETQGWNWTLELPIGGNCRYYLQNSTIISNNTGDDSYDGIKPRNTFGCLASGTSFEIYDGTIVNNNGTYCIHDEANGDRGYYKHVYSNIKFVANGSTCCIGAGVGEFADIIIKDCIFESSGTTNSADVFYHGMELKHTHTSNIKLFVSGCYFTKKFGWGGYIGGNGDRDDVFNLVYTGNKAISVPTNDDNAHISVVSYNNS